MKIDCPPECHIPDDKVPKEVRRKWLLNLALDMIEKYILKSTKLSDTAQEVAQIQMAMSTKWKCRSADCNKEFTYHSGRVK